MSIWKWFVLDVTRWSVGALAMIGIGFISYYCWKLIIFVPLGIASIYGALIVGSYLVGMASECWHYLRRRT
jgi:hypothetical protein